MRNNHPILTYAYHFLSETIILFMIVLPFLHHRFMWVPYGSYIVIAIIVCIIFSILTKYTENKLWYISLAPFLFVAYYLLEYPLVLAILFSGVFVWRYINIRNEETVSRENNYILITLALIAINSILISDSRIMIYPFILFATIIFGYIASHLAVVQKKERKQFDKKLSIYFIGLLAAGAGLFFLIFDGIRFVIVSVIQGVLDIFASIIAGIAQLFRFLDPEEMEVRELEEGEAGENPAAEYWNDLAGPSLFEIITPYVVIAVSLLFLTLLVFVVIWIWKNRRYPVLKNPEQDASVSYQELELDSEPSASTFSRWRKLLFSQPVHPVRKKVYQLERTAARHKMGRKKSETIEAWLRRIGVDADFDVYQRVRYADADVSDSEANQLKEQIREMERIMREQKEKAADGS